METTQPLPDYWAMTNKELIIICKNLSIQRWSGKRKKDLVALIRAKIGESLEVLPEVPTPTPTPTRPQSPPVLDTEKEKEPYEFLDETLLEHANRARAFLPKSPTPEEEPTYEWKAAQTTPATEGPIVRLPVGTAANSFTDMDISLHIEF